MNSRAAVFSEETSSFAATAMGEDQAFQELIRRVRARDQEAAAELVSQYEPIIRRYLRVRLTDPRLRRLFDSLDMKQSVFKRFFQKATQGDFRLDKPSELLNLLLRMAQNRLIEEVRRQSADRRGYGRNVGSEALDTVPAATASPSHDVALRDLYNEIRRRLTDDERSLADQWAEGKSWVEIGGVTRAEQDRLRHNFDRAFRRVAGQLVAIQGEDLNPDYLKAVYRTVAEQAARPWGDA